MTTLEEAFASLQEREKRRKLLEPKDLFSWIEDFTPDGTMTGYYDGRCFGEFVPHAFKEDVLPGWDGKDPIWCDPFEGVKDV